MNPKWHFNAAREFKGKSGGILVNPMHDDQTTAYNPKHKGYHATFETEEKTSRPIARVSNNETNVQHVVYASGEVLHLGMTRIDEHNKLVKVLKKAHDALKKCAVEVH